MHVFETDRLRLRWATREDAAFILELVTDPSWTRGIGKSKVENLEDAARYIDRALIAMYQSEGFGLFVVELKESGEPLGLCGLIRRDTLDDVDLGFAMLPAFCRQGYCSEAARATLDYGKEKFALERIVAITSKQNPASVGLLEKLGFEFEELIQPGPSDEELMLFGISV